VWFGLVCLGADASLKQPKPPLSFTLPASGARLQAGQRGQYVILFNGRPWIVGQGLVGEQRWTLAAVPFRLYHDGALAVGNNTEQLTEVYSTKAT